MNKKEYGELVKRVSPKPKRFANGAIAFLIGGLIGVLGETINWFLQSQFNMPQSEAIVWVVLIFIFLGCLFTVLHVFDDWVNFAKAGLLIPITGFAHSICSSAMDYKGDGMITGLGANFFKLAGSVLLFGIVSAFVVAIAKVIIYG